MPATASVITPAQNESNAGYCCLLLDTPKTYELRRDAKAGLFVAVCTMTWRGSCVNDRMYGLRNLYDGGMFEGKIDNRVLKTGSV